MVSRSDDFLTTVGTSDTLWWLSLIPAAILLVLWILIARSAFIQGEDMERPSRVGQLYGYTVCLVAVVVFLASVNSFVEHATALSDPLQATTTGFFGEPASLTSFESYRATADRERQLRATMPGATVTSDTTSEATLRARYEALRADRIAHVRFDARRGLMTSGLMIVLAVVLFVLHWRWLRPRNDVGAA